MTKGRAVQIFLELSQILSIDHMLKDFIAESLTYALHGDNRVFHVLVEECLMGQICFVMVLWYVRGILQQSSFVTQWCQCGSGSKVKDGASAINTRSALCIA